MHSDRHSNLCQGNMRSFFKACAWESLVSFFKRAPDGVNSSGNRGIQVVDHETVKLSVL